MKNLIGLFFLAMAIPVMAQTDELKNLPGYVDFGSLDSSYGEPKVEINIGPSMLGFVSALSKDSDPDTAKLLKGLKGVRVLVYKVGDEPAAAIARMDKIAGRLKGDRWEQIVKVNDDQDHARIFVKMGQGTMDGLIVLATDDDNEAVFVNVLGQLDPENIGKVTHALHVNIGDGRHDRDHKHGKKAKSKKDDEA